MSEPTTNHGTDSDRERAEAEAAERAKFKVFEEALFKSTEAFNAATRAAEEAYEAAVRPVQLAYEAAVIRARRARSGYANTEAADAPGTANPDVPWPRGTEALADLVKNRPMAHVLPPKCPYCKDEKMKETGHSQTLLGGDPDPNHHWRGFRCAACGSEFVYQHKYDHGWFTFKNHCIAGVHACYEPVEYACAKCGGPVRPECRDLDGKTPHGPFLGMSFEGGVAKRNYRTFWKCGGCGAEIGRASCRERV